MPIRMKGLPIYLNHIGTWKHSSSHKNLCVCFYCVLYIYVVPLQGCYVRIVVKKNLFILNHSYAKVKRTIIDSKT